MTDQTTQRNSNWKPLVLIGIVFVAGAAITSWNNHYKQYVDISGKLIISKNSPFADWYGKNAPDFTVTDINGKQQKLSDHIGKDVLIVFWATWCPPCNMEIPHLIELRKQVSEKDLAILALSNESYDIVKSFANNKGLNYTTAAIGNSLLPKPYIDVVPIPTSFYIDKNGKIKYAVTGMIGLESMKAILNAE